MLGFLRREACPNAAFIGFSLRRSCHEVTDEVKSIGLLLPTAVRGHTALRGASALCVGRYALMPPKIPKFRTLMLPMAVLAHRLTL